MVPLAALIRLPAVLVIVEIGVTNHPALWTTYTVSACAVVPVRRVAVWPSAPVTTGMALINTLHTTCALFINEFQAALLTDIRAFLERMVARDAPYLHNDPRHSDCDRMNADSHLRAMLLGHTLTLQISGGEVVLGQWQRILMAELDGPRARSLRIQVLGIS